MRRFVILVHKVPITGAFTLNDLAGGAGRMDEIARAVSTAFTISNDLRRDTEVTLLLSAPDGGIGRRIRILGSRIRHLNPDERSTAALLKNALTRAVDHLGEFESSPGLVIAGASPLSELDRLSQEPGAVWLTEEGAPLRSIAWEPPHFFAILSDPFDPTPEEVSVLTAARLPRVSVGPRALRTSQVLDVVQAELDLREAAAADRGPPT